MSTGPRANQSPGAMPEGTASLPSLRLHVGLGVRAPQIDRLRIAFFGIYAADGVSLLFERDADVDTVATYAETSLEAGIQLSLDAWRDDESYGEPFMRLALASQTAYANSDRYPGSDGNPQFEATGILATIGFNIGFVAEEE